jgi:transposase
LDADGVQAVNVPAKLARRVRLLSTGHGRKTDEADALSVGIAALTATRLNTAVINEALAALRAVTEHRDDLVRTRTQTVNRMHVLLAQLIPSGLPRKPTADTAAAALRGIRPRTLLARTLRRLDIVHCGEMAMDLQMPEVYSAGPRPDLRPSPRLEEGQSDRGAAPSRRLPV